MNSTVNSVRIAPKGRDLVCGQEKWHVHKGHARTGDCTQLVPHCMRHAAGRNTYDLAEPPSTEGSMTVLSVVENQPGGQCG